MFASFVVQKHLSFIAPHLQIVGLNACIIEFCSENPFLSLYKLKHTFYVALYLSDSGYKVLS